jgi:hypothetical protein
MEKETKLYDHPLNIKIGKGRVLFDAASYASMAPAWILPGGRRTTDQLEARAAAEWIDNNANMRLKP